jgi:hypothetical protein
MTLDIDKYRVNIPHLKVFLDRQEGDERRHGAVSEFAVVSGVPVLACFYYYAELYGMTPEIQKSIDSLTEFYRISEL